MSLTNILLVAAIIYGIVLLIGLFVKKEKPRTIHLEKMKKFLEGQLEPLERHPNSYKLIFVVEGTEFVFEDIIEEVGFSSNQFKGYLKVQTQSNLTFSFTEKETTKVRTNIVRATEIPAQGVDIRKVIVPPEFQEFYIHTNSPRRVNALFADDEVLSILKGFKNRDFRGRPSLSLEIKEGLIVLEFHSNRLLRPHIYQLHDDYSVIEKYVDQLMILVKKLNGLGRVEIEKDNEEL